MKTYKVTVDNDNTIYWYNEDGRLHREDGPAIEYASGTKSWYLNGQLHREDGPAVEWADGTKKWYLNGQLHREDGPAYEGANGTKSWHINGELHREDGPAIEWANSYKEWYLNDEELTEEEFNNTKQQGTDPITEWLKEIKNDFIPQVKVETDVYYDLIGGRTIKKWEYYLNERDGTWGTYQAALQGHIMNIIKKKLDQI